MMRIKQDLIELIGVLILCITSSIYTAHEAWTEWQVKKELTRIGVPISAFMQSCSGRNCSVTYQYEVPSPDGQIKRYSGHEYLGCAGCEEGYYILIEYLPQDPAQARIAGRNMTGWFIFMSVGSFIIAIVAIQFYRGKWFPDKKRIS